MSGVVPITNVPLAYKLTVDDYLMLDGAGVFEHHGKTELLDGEIIFMNAQHRPHARVKSRLHIVIAAALANLDNGMEALVEGSVGVPPYSVPEPDIAITDAPDGTGLVPLSSVKLVVEVADTTVGSDLTRKASIYARAAIAEYWVIDVNRSIIHQLWAPDDGDYTHRRTVAFGEAVTAQTILGLTITTDRL